jgi:DeoR/GlpR family transcriptional regulator of sugar metabolism
MSKYTGRDKIWNIALKNDSITSREISEMVDVSERTARDCLQTMHNQGWLEKNGGDGSKPVTYQSVIDPAPKEKLLDEITN